MSTHNIGFYEDLTKIITLIIIKYHQICTLFLLLYIMLTVGSISQNETPYMFNPPLTLLIKNMSFCETQKTKDSIIMGL